MEFFSDRLPGIDVSEVVEILQLLQFGRQLFQEWTFHIGIGERVFSQHRHIGGGGKLGPDFRIEISISGKALRLRKRDHRLLDILTRPPIDFAR